MPNMTRKSATAKMTIKAISLQQEEQDSVKIRKRGEIMIGGLGCEGEHSHAIDKPVVSPGVAIHFVGDSISLLIEIRHC